MDNVETEKIMPADNSGKPLDSWPSILAYFIFFCYIAVIFDQATSNNDADFFLTWGAVGGLVVWGIIGFHRGFLNEVVGLLRWVVPAGVAYTTGSKVGALAGYPNFIGTCIGTPVAFFAAYFAFYLMLGPVYNKPRRPSLPGQFAGLLFGMGEAALVIGMLGFLLGIVPIKGLEMRSSITAELGEALSTELIKPWLAANASGPILLMQLASDRRFLENAEKVDWNDVRNQLGNVVRHPKLQVLSQNQELHQLLREKRLADFFKHPTVTALMTDPELHQIGESIDWQKLHATMSRCMQNAATQTQQLNAPPQPSFRRQIPTDMPSDSFEQP